MMTDEDRDKWYPVLADYYRQKGEAEDRIPDIVNTVLAEAQAGWKRAPRDLDTRIKMKSGYQWKSHANLKPKKKEEIEENIKSNKEEDISFEITSSMTKKERDWFELRLKDYVTDFDFNNSSDKPLLEQLLVEELIQRRLFGLQLKYIDRDYSKKMSESLKRVSDIQTKLGITREQRAGALDNIDGNVAQISVDLNEKLKKMPEKIRREEEEELYYSNLKKQRPIVNILPAPEKLEAMLRIDGKTTANLDSEHISIITEQVAKEITEVNESNKEKPPLKELAEGIDVSR